MVNDRSKWRNNKMGQNQNLTSTDGTGLWTISISVSIPICQCLCLYLKSLRWRKLSIKWEVGEYYSYIEAIQSRVYLIRHEGRGHVVEISLLYFPQSMRGQKLSLGVNKTFILGMREKKIEMPRLRIKSSYNIGRTFY